MEVTKKKYKQIEFGLIPEDWKVITYEEAFKFLPTATYSRAQLTNNDEIKYVHYGDIHTKYNYFLKVDNSLPTISKNQSKRYALVENGDVIMADASEDYEGVGKSVEVLNPDNQKVISGLHTFLFRDKNKNFTNGFKAYISESELVKKAFQRLATGMKVYGVSKTNLKSIQIPLPPLPEQKAIAQVLSDTDNLIQAITQKLAKKRAIKQGAMQQLLTPKEDWEVLSFPEVCWFQEGPGVRKHQFTTKGVKLLNGTNIEKGNLLLDKTNTHISEDEAFGWYSHFLVDAGDILIACSGITITKFEEKVTIANKDHLPLCMNTSTMRFKIKNEKLNKNFLFHFLKSDSFKSQIGGKATGSAQLNFGPSHVTKVNIDLPKPNLQNEIATILSDMDAEIGQLEQKLSKYKLLKQGLMQQLLTGKIRLV